MQADAGSWVVYRCPVLTGVPPSITIETVEVDIFDVLIDQRHVVMIGSKSGEQGEAGHGQVGAFAS